MMRLHRMRLYLSRIVKMAKLSQKQSAELRSRSLDFSGMLAALVDEKITLNSIRHSPVVR